ncbi:MAG TPA: response regulator transcription factor [Clostridiales bacterium]|nr:response regulator transcription factor [Clostridiales bacterium]
MFKVAICDDEQSICASVESIISEFKMKSYLEIDMEVFYSGEDLYKCIKNGHGFDLIFLDIEMDELNGVEVGRKIREEMDDYITQIVYISGKDNYDRQLFDVQPLYFLPKPLSPKKVIKALQLAMKLSNKLGGVFTYKKGYEVFTLSVKDIIYFESLDRKIKIVSTKGEEYFYGKISDIIQKVAKYQFIQIHRSYIINYAHTRVFRYDEVVMSNSITLPISQLRRKEVRKLQITYQKKN